MEPARKHPLIDDSGSRPKVAGSGVKVGQLAYEHEVLNWPLEDIQSAHPHLTLAQIHAALAYFCDHPTLIRKEWDEDRKLIAEARAKFPSVPGSAI